MELIPPTPPRRPDRCACNLEPALLLWWWWGWLGDLFGAKEFVGRIVIPNIPKVLSHGHDEGSNHKDGEDCCVFACCVKSRKVSVQYQ
jgi:hypothetical protein